VGTKQLAWDENRKGFTSLFRKPKATGFPATAVRCASLFTGLLAGVSHADLPCFRVFKALLNQPDSGEST
jgi:hypothetical protein